MKYFAYGSNMFSSRLKKRVPSCKFCEVGILKGYVLKFNKKSVDGSGKANVIPSQNEENEVIGVVYDFDPNEQILLDGAEGGGYSDTQIQVITLQGVVNVYMYIAHPNFIDDSLIPYIWYKNFVVEGAKEHTLPDSYIKTIMEFPAKPDPDKNREKKNLEILLCQS